MNAAVEQEIEDDFGPATLKGMVHGCLGQGPLVRDECEEASDSPHGHARDARPQLKDPMKRSFFVLIVSKLWLGAAQASSVHLFSSSADKTITFKYIFT